MRSSRSLLLLPVAAGLVLTVLTGCGPSTGGGSGNGAGGPTSTGPHSSAASPAPPATVGVPTPDAGQTAALLAALSAVDPNLAFDATEAVSDATTLCSGLRQGDDPSTAVPSAFPKVDLTAAQRTAVAAAVTTSFCPLGGGAGGGASSAAATPSPSGS